LVIMISVKETFAKRRVFDNISLKIPVLVYTN